MNRLTWLNACSSGISIAAGISSVATFATFVGLPVSVALGAASLTGAIASGIISTLTKKYQITNNKKRSHTQLDSRKQVIAFQDRVITINIKEAQHPLKREKQVIDKSSIMLKISTKSMHRVLV